MTNVNGLSSTGCRWQILQTDANIDLMCQVLGVSPTLAKVMANRGLRSKNAVLSFLQISIDNLRPFSLMKDADRAITRIIRAIETGENITVFGDYDADGVTSTVILYKVLTRLGAKASYYIPHRVAEGYGLTTTSVQKLADAGSKLIIAIDSGISAIDEITLAATLGMDTVVVDHHEQGEILPPAVAIINPKQRDCTYPFKEMCAGGLAYKLADALCAKMGAEFTEKEESLVLAAIATICDIVPLQDENRILANCGLILLNANKKINHGLSCLLEARQYMEKPIDVFSMGYIVGPCINAAGRLDNAEKAVELLCSTDHETCAALTDELLRLNDERKNLTATAVDRLLATLTYPLPKVLVLFDPDTHESIAGIVAGRMRETTGRPTIVLTKGGEAMKGSGRSPACYSLFEALHANRHLFVRFGGHAMAAGLTILEENIPILRDALNETCTLTEDDFTPQIEIDDEISLENITITLADELSRLAPFGKDNHEPMFVSRYVYVENVRVINEKSTLIFTFKSPGGGRVKGIAFGMNDAWAQATEQAGVAKTGGFFMDIVYKAETNVYNGNVSVQVRVRDFKIRG